MLSTIRSQAIWLLATGLFSLIQLTSMQNTAAAAAISVPCGEPAALIAAVKAANSTPAEDTIHLAAGCTYTFSRPSDPGPNGANALPKISAPLNVEGHGATLLRSSGGDVTEFRFFETTAGVSLKLNRVTLKNGYGDDIKGGAVFSAGPLTITDSIFWGNNANFGGALHLGGKTSISGSLFIENFANKSGGAILVIYPDDQTANNPQVEITNTTITANSAWDGSAISTMFTIRLINSTIARNYSNNDGDDSSAALHIYPPGKIEIKNSILDNLNKFNCYSSIDDLGGNLYSDVDNCVTGGTAGDTGLGLLADNGGPTSTIALLPDRPEIEMEIKDCPSVDQRGFPRSRPDQTCDAGAYESGGMIFSRIQVQPDSAKVGEPVIVELTLDNRLGRSASSLAFSGMLPIGLTVAGTAAIYDICGGTFSAAQGGRNFALQDGALASNQSCTIRFSVIGWQPDQYVIKAGLLSSREGGTTPITAEADFVVKTDTGIVMQCCSGSVRLGTTLVVPVEVRPVTPGLVMPRGVVLYEIQEIGQPKRYTGQQALEEGKAVIKVALEHAGRYQMQVRYAGSRLFNASLPTSQKLTVYNRLFLPLTSR